MPSRIRLRRVSRGRRRHIVKDVLIDVLTRAASAESYWVRVYGD